MRATDKKGPGQRRMYPKPRSVPAIPIERLVSPVVRTRNRINYGQANFSHAIGHYVERLGRRF